MPVLHFDHAEFYMRRDRVQKAMAARGLDGLVLFAPESHYWLTGYDTFGFAMFQAMVLTGDGKICLLTRAPDLRQAQQTSLLQDSEIRIWVDREGVDPALQLRDVMAGLGLGSRRVGIETKTAGLTYYNGQRVAAAVDGICTLVEASDLVTLERRHKSPREIDYHRRAAVLADDALDAAIATTGAHAFEGDILAAMQGAVFKGDGDYAGNEFIIGSGEGALLCRYRAGRRRLEAQDQMTLEWAGAYRRYHAAMMRTLVVGHAPARQRQMHSAAVEALEACEAAIRPGRPMGDVFDAHARVFDRRGLGHARLNACGYGMGAIYNPIWVDFPMFYEGNSLLMEAGQVFFLHMILMDSQAGLAMCWGHSVLVKPDGVERLSRHPLDLVEIK
jgi:Xaa-Pro dipeptidase